MNWRKKGWTFVGIVVLVGAGLISWRVMRGSAQASTPPTAATQIPAAATAVPQVNLNNEVDAIGNARTNRSAVLTWQTSGVVGQVNVKTGDKVQDGSILASLDPASWPVDVITAQSDLISATVSLQDLQQSKTPQAQAEVDLLNAQKTYSDTLQTQQELIHWTSQPNYKDAELHLSLAQTDLDRARAAYKNTPGNPRSNPDKARATFALRIASRRFQSAQRWLDRLGVPTQAELDKAAANTALALAQLQDAQRAQQQVANGPSSADLAAAQARMNSDQQKIDTTRLTAPFTGVISQVTIKSGDVISPTTTAFQIDDTSKMYVDLQVSEVDINKVKPGQSVALVFDAISGKTYHGQVTQVAQVGTNNNGSIFYTATVQMTDADPRVKPGMTANATITIQ